jgi:hypothetical protein
VLPLLLAALLAPPARQDPGPYLEPAESLCISLLPSYFQVHSPSLSDDFGLALVSQVPLSPDAFLEIAGRWWSGEAGGRGFDLGIGSLGLSWVGSNHGMRFVFSGGAAVLASGDLDDGVDVGVFAAFQFDLPVPGNRHRITFRYEAVVPETDAAIGGRELELIQGFSAGLALTF